MEHRVLDLIGLTLDEARDAWRESGVRDDDIEIVETAPPLRPPRREKSERRKTKTPTKAPKPASKFGAWRVLRVVEVDGKIEVTVAREELKPDTPEIAPVES